jgi:hypothetical protein
MRVVTASDDKTARVWDATTGQPLTPPLEHQSRVVSAAFSPDGTRVVTASLDKTARVWDGATGKPLTPPLEHQGLLSSAAFSPDGTHVVTASSDHTARVWHVPLDTGALPQWSAIAERSPFVLTEQGVLVRRTPPHVQMPSAPLAPPPIPAAPPAAPAAAIPTATGSNSNSNSASNILSLLRLAKPGNSDMDGAIAKIEAQRRSAPADELPMFDLMLTTMREYQEADTDKPHQRDHLVKGSQQLIDLLRAMAEHEKRDVAAERVLVSSLSMMPYQLENLELADHFDLPALRQEALARGRALVQDFPKDARSWKLLAWLEAESGGGELAAMRAYLTCTRLDPKLAECAKLLADARMRYTQPACDGADANPQLAWYEGTDQGTVGAPRFTAKDVARLHTGVQHMNAGTTTDAATGEVIGHTPATDTPVVVLELRPKAVKAMTRWIQDLQNNHHFLVIKLGARVLADTRDQMFGDRDQPAWSFTHVKLDDLCTKTSRQTLPPDLAAP